MLTKQRANGRIRSLYKRQSFTFFQIVFRPKTIQHVMGTNKDGEEGIILRKIKRHGSRERQGTPLLQESADRMYVKKTQRTKESRDELPFRRLKRQGRHVWEQRLRKDFIKAADSHSSLEVKSTETLRAFDF